MSDRRPVDRNLEASVAELYRGPREQFVVGRKALVDQLEGTAPESVPWVKRLKKPSILAWAINRFRTDHPIEFAALVESGGNLRRALEAGDPTVAMAARRAAVEEALECLDEDWSRLGSDLTVSQRRKLAATLEALSVGGGDDDEVAAGLAGRLERDLSPPGLESLVGLVVGGAAKQGAVRTRSPVLRGRRGKSAGARAPSDSDVLAQKKKDVSVARAKLKRSQKALAALEAQGEAARARVLEVQTQLTEVRAARAELRGRIEKARGEARRAERAVNGLERDFV